ncbi:NDR1/HIN1-like protein 13 [Bienertia sinuspersici]
MTDNGALKKPPGYKDSSTPTPPLKPPPQAAASAVPPPRKPPVVPPSYYKPKKKRRSCCCRCCCCFLCIILFLIVLILAFVGIFYLLYQPKLPTFVLRPIELDRFNVTPKPDGTAVLNSQITIRVEVKNPNSKIKIYYGETEVSLKGDEETQLGSASVGAFEQPTNNVTLLRVTAKVDKQEVDGAVGKKLMERVKNKLVVVNAEVKTKIGIGVFNTKFGMIPVEVNCGGVTLKQLNHGNTSPKCSFNSLWGW